MFALEMEQQGQGLGKPYGQQQHREHYPVHRTGEHRHAERHGQDHPGDKQREEKHARYAVGGEHRFAVFPLAEAGNDVDNAVSSINSMPMAALTSSMVTDAVSLEHLEAGQYMLVAEDAAVYAAENNGGNTYARQYAAQPHAALFIHVQPHEYEYHPLADVSEHHAKEQAVRKREEQPRVGLP